MNKPVCNRSSVSHIASARSKYYRRVTLCFVATIVIGLMTNIVIPEARIYWVLGWTPVLCYVHWRYWIRLAKDGYFDCDECRKLKHTRHIKVFIEPKSGVCHVWCDVCLLSMRSRARAMREIRSIIAGMLVSERESNRWRSHSLPYQPQPKPELRPVSALPEVTIVRHGPGPGPELKVSDPQFRIKRPATV